MKRNGTRLRLLPETIRSLSTAELGHAVGGGSTVCKTIGALLGCNTLPDCPRPTGGCPR